MNWQLVCVYLYVFGKLITQLSEHLKKADVGGMSIISVNRPNEKSQVVQF